jgi:hypothetical protein
MKKALAGVLVASFIGLMAGVATAQVPHVQIYFNGNTTYNTFSGTGEDCKSPGTAPDLYVVMRGWNMFLLLVDFSIDFPPALFFAGETRPANTLQIGSSPSTSELGGIAISWNVPQNGYEDLLALTVHTFWTSNCDCNSPPQSLVVRGFDYNNPEAGGSLDPRAVRWPDYAELPGVGMTSLVCPGIVSTEETTWGGVKALYR